VDGDGSRAEGVVSAKGLTSRRPVYQSIVQREDVEAEEADAVIAVCRRRGSEKGGSVTRTLC